MFCSCAQHGALPFDFLILNIMPMCMSGHKRIAKLPMDLDFRPNVENATTATIGIRQQASIMMPCFLCAFEGAGDCIFCSNCSWSMIRSPL